MRGAASRPAREALDVLPEAVPGAHISQRVSCILRQRTDSFGLILHMKADAVANMAVVDDIYRVGGMAPRRTTAPLPRPAGSTVTTVTHPDGTSVVVSTSGGAAL